ncbi:preprotein translocase subunit SecE [Sphingomonas spermidinifaciens]|uniref:Protein translocase subunit SecE n=1 Tax=Sphingomonas spermidinifaciens TaxID=1141889 RepID=A0A2A4B1G9_9SPHN|nr:preprotein translocase subunit SecE [Sphingomonas spermidinifaciens]
MDCTDFPEGNGQQAHARLAADQSRISEVAKTSPSEFIRQVRAETAKVVWPTRRETVMTAVMVVIMTSLLAIFFLGVDTFFDTLVKFLLSLAQKG